MSHIKIPYHGCQFLRTSFKMFLRYRINKSRKNKYKVTVTMMFD